MFMQKMLGYTSRVDQFDQFCRYICLCKKMRGYTLRVDQFCLWFVTFFILWHTLSFVQKLWISHFFYLNLPKDLICLRIERVLLGLVCIRLEMVIEFIGIVYT